MFQFDLSVFRSVLTRICAVVRGETIVQGLVDEVARSVTEDEYENEEDESARWEDNSSREFFTSS